MSAEDAARVATEAAMDRLPPRLRTWAAWLLSRWLGRTLFSSTVTLNRIEVFDRSMSLAAQFFTSVFPILLVAASWVGANDAAEFADAIDMPAQSQTVLSDAVRGSTGATFGIVGAFLVLVSATSLSRALARAFAAIWGLPRPKSRPVLAWRWLAVVVVLALSLVMVRALSGFAAGLPPRNVWQLVVTLMCDAALAVFVPWTLLAGAAKLRVLAPGAVLFALVMLVVRPASRAYLSRALEVSADRYGSIGVAFTYLAWLYILAFVFLVTAVVGEAIATDQGRLGRWIHGGPAAIPEPDQAASGPASTPA